jgi:DNA-directed RNA polymerase subunit RPC12/RpoP
MFAELKTAEQERKYCRKCGHPDVMRIPRNWRDRLWERLGSQRQRRYRCGRCSAEATWSSRQEND